MGRNEKDWSDIKNDGLKRLSKIADELTVRDKTYATTSVDIAITALMLARIVDALEELNENIKNLATDRNTNPAHADDGECKCFINI